MDDLEYHVENQNVIFEAKQMINREYDRGLNKLTSFDAKNGLYHLRNLSNIAIFYRSKSEHLYEYSLDFVKELAFVYKMMNDTKRENQIKKVYLEGIIQICEGNYKKAEANIKNLYWLTKGYIIQDNYPMRRLSGNYHYALTNYYKEVRK